MAPLSYSTTAGCPVEPEVWKTRYFPSSIRPTLSMSLVKSLTRAMVTVRSVTTSSNRAISSGLVTGGRSDRVQQSPRPRYSSP